MGNAKATIVASGKTSKVVCCFLRVGYSSKTSIPTNDSTVIIITHSPGGNRIKAHANPIEYQEI